MRYLLDSNVLIILNRHLPRDVHGGVWDAMEDMIRDGRAYLHGECLSEIAQGGDGLDTWAKGLDGFVIEPDSTEVARVRQIANLYPGWVQEKKNAADPWLIAKCEAEDLILVTDERLKPPNVAPHNSTIPTVIAGLQSPVTCLKSVDMQRQEKWRFVQG